MIHLNFNLLYVSDYFFCLIKKSNKKNQEPNMLPRALPTAPPHLARADALVLLPNYLAKDIESLIQKLGFKIFVTF
jgi:hypothetical protein